MPSMLVDDLERELKATRLQLRNTLEELRTVKSQLSEKNRQAEQSHDDLTNFFAGTGVATLILNNELRIKRMTPAAEQLLSVDEDCIGCHVGQIARSLLQNGLAEEAGKVLQSLTPSSAELQNENGHWINRRILPYRTQGGEIDGVVVTLFDVTLTRDAHEDRQRLAAIVESSTDAIVSKTMEGTITSWNRGAEQLFGYAAAEMIGQPISRLVPVDREDETAQILSRLQHGERIAHFETRRVTKDGRTLDVSLSVSPILDSSGRVIGAAKVARDVTERKHALMALKASEERYRALVEMQSELICRMRLDGTLTFVNNAYAKARGKSAGALIGDNFWHGIFREDCAVGQRRLKEITPDKPQVRTESRFMGADGVRWVLWTGRALEFGSGGRAHEVQITGVDITERKAMEEQLRAADVRKTEFLAVLGHELRNPLAPLRAGLDLLERSGGDVRLVSRVQDMMSRQLGHLVHLVNELLDVSRLSRGRIELVRKPVNVNDVARSAVELTALFFARRQHKLTIAVPSDPVVVNGDSDRLIQVVGNLLHNSAKFTDAGGQISLSVTAEDGSACIRVRDNGLGFSKDEAGRLFEMFAQIAEHRRYIGGGGLGVSLALSRRLIRLHGGSISASSEGPRRGSEFTIRVPLASAGDNPVLAAEAPATGSSACDSCRVLVVDDNEDVTETMRLVLEASGHAVRTLNDGLSVVDVACEFRPDVILLDIGLPQIDGFEIGRRIRALPWGSEVLLLAITGWGQAEDKRAAANAGFDVHITKPVDTAQLLALIAERSAPTSD